MRIGGEMRADYKQMYLKLLNATENAMEMLIAAQRQCEPVRRLAWQSVSKMHNFCVFMQICG